MRRRPALAAGVSALALAAALGTPPSLASPRTYTSPRVFTSPRAVASPRLGDPAEALALTQALRLPPAALALVEAHARLLQDLARPSASAKQRPKPTRRAPHPTSRARQGGSGDPHGACRLLASAGAVRAALFDALAPRVAEADRVERHLTRELLRGLARALPGVGARLPLPADAPLEAGIDHGALALALPAGAPGVGLLAVAGGLRDPAGPPAYLRPAAMRLEGVTPRLEGSAPPVAGACADFGRVLGPLGRLPAAWKAAPPCLRARLQVPLREAVVKMGEQADFCRDEAAARAQAREAARLLTKLAPFGGPGTGKRIGHNFRSYGLRFDLAP